ncbi:hypothetical protein KKE26_02520 [bacterium]|nr:hypothetical protein [bacterium]MBU1754061.1 hypothetical protein [bacterium]
MKNLINLDKLPERVKGLIMTYVAGLIDIYATNLKSIMIYGSAAQKEDFVPGRSNINLLIILNEITLSDLKKGAKLVSMGKIHKKIVPLFLTLRHINTSSDVFPIEFLEMRENHVLIYGDEIFDSIVIQPENIRLQCESTLKGQLIKLRQAYLELAAKPELLERLMIDSMTGLMPTLRNTLRLKGRAVVTIKKHEVINQLKEEYGVDAVPLLKVWHSKLRVIKLAKGEVESVFEQYLDVIQCLAIAIDKLRLSKGLQ